MVTNNSKEILCEVEGCFKPVEKKRMCNPHYQRVRLGRPVEARMRPKRYGSLEGLFEFNSQKTDHGIIWIGSISRGYGVVNYDGKRYRAHRLHWEFVKGPIPEGMELDHEPDCPKNCITIEHLTPRTKSDHAKLGWERGQHDGNGWLRGGREKRMKQGTCLVCGIEYVRDNKAKYCGTPCHTKASNDRRKTRALEEKTAE